MPGRAIWVPRRTVANEGALAKGGLLLLYSPSEVAYDVFDGRSHMLRLRAVGGPVTYDVFVLARCDDEPTDLEQVDPILPSEQ